MQISQAQVTIDITQRLSLYKLAIRNLTTAQRLNPLLPAPLVSLAQTNQLAAQLAATKAEAANFANAANGYYAEALRVDPNNADDWNAWARLNLTVRGDLAASLKQIQSSLAVDSQYGPTYALYGDYWAVLGNNEPDPATQQTDYQQAADNYSHALSLQPDAAALPTRLSLGQAQTVLKQYDTAIATFEDLIQRAPDAGNVWVVYNSLAKAYLGKGDKLKALENAFLAYNFAPDLPSKDQVQAFIDQVK
jgi:tetratricopeptide (TPR) repeat protein